MVSSTENLIAQRFESELSAAGHDVVLELHGRSTSRLKATASEFQPELIVGLALTRAMPESIVADYLCLLVEPCIQMDGETCDVALRTAAPRHGEGRLFATRRLPSLRSIKPGQYKQLLAEHALDCLLEALTIIPRSFTPRKTQSLKQGDSMLRLKRAH